MGRKGETCHQFLSPGFFMATETLCIVNNWLPVLQNIKMFQFAGEGSRKIDVTFWPPPFYQFISHNSRIVQLSQIRPWTALPQCMIQIDQNKRLIRSRISKPKDSTTTSRSHFCFYSIIYQLHSIIARRSPFLFMRIT